MSCTSVSRATTTQNYERSEFDDVSHVKKGSSPSYDDYDDFPLNLRHGAPFGGRGGYAYQKRNKDNEKQIYSSRHTRLRENRVLSAKGVSPKR